MLSNVREMVEGEDKASRLGERAGGGIRGRDITENKG
jgi:hypothetical protein